MSVDIIIPTYNRAQLLPATLASIQRQSYRGWQCWVAEDGETDATQAALAPFLSDPRIHYLPGPHRGLPASVRNRAIQMGVAQFVAFLDDDDLWLPEKLARQVAFLEAHPEVVLVGSDAYRWLGQDDWLGCPTYLPVSSRKGAVSFAELTLTNVVINSSAVVRRETLESTGLLSEDPRLRAVEDFELWLRVATRGQVIIDAEPLVLYRDMPLDSIRQAPSLEHHYQVMAELFEALTVWLERESPSHLAPSMDRARFFRAGPSALLKWRVNAKEWLRGKFRRR